MNRSLMLLTGTSALLLTACSTPAPHYYTLTPTVTALSDSSVRVIEILPVGLPDRLNRSQMVLQQSDGTTNLLDEQRWASTLSSELQAGLSTGLQQQLGAVDRYNSGMAGGQVAYRIATNFSRFDIIGQTQHKKLLAEHLNVDATWIVKRLDPNPTPIDHKAGLAADRQLSCRMAFSTTVPADQPAMSNVAGAARLSLSQVVNAIAVSVNALESGKAVSLDGVTCS